MGVLLTKDRAWEPFWVYSASPPQGVYETSARHEDVCSSSHRQEASETAHECRRAPPARTRAACHRSAISALLGGSDRAVYDAEADCVGQSCLPCYLR